jgi:hypothetical protein
MLMVLVLPKSLIGIAFNETWPRCVAIISGRIDMSAPAATKPGMDSPKDTSTEKFGVNPLIL